MEGPLYGEILAFTGALGMTRQKAADMAAQAGCDVAGNVSKNVTLLVVGVQDKTRLKGYEKSAKHRQAEELILKGQDIQILSERDFLKLVSPCRKREGR